MSPFKIFAMKPNHKIPLSFKLYSSMNILKIILLVLLNLLISCKKFVEIGPPKTEVASSTVFNNDATATSVMTGVYSKMMSGSGFASGGSFSITVLSGLSSDELLSYSQSNQQFWSQRDWAGIKMLIDRWMCELTYQFEKGLRPDEFEPANNLMRRQTRTITTIRRKQ